MKILHTADWHLGQGFYERDRLQEQERFIGFLLETIAQEKVDLLIIAGDVFDTANPPRAAEHLYYDFIARLSALHHCELVVVGGNHDSAAHLEAPKSLLKSLRVHVVGSLPDDLSQAVLRFECGGRRLCVAAIPFLRDRDVRRAVEGESFDEMEARTKAGIARVYKDMAELVLADKREDEIILATGHLTAVGGQLSDSERSVHIGNLGSIGAEQLSPGFDYVALGHLHHSQVVGGDECIRYSGSPIPLSFSESLNKEMRLLTINEKNQLEQQALKIPLARRLIRLAGSLDEVLAEIAGLKMVKDELCPWIEVMLSEGEVNPSINDQIREAAAKQGAEVCKVSRKSSVARFDPVDGELVKSIDEWEPGAVFAQRIESYEGDVDKKTLVECFNHVLNEVNEEG